jgi:hypothetical protein
MSCLLSHAQIHGFGAQSVIELINCQLSISCAYIRSPSKVGFVRRITGFVLWSYFAYTRVYG